MVLLVVQAQYEAFYRNAKAWAFGGGSVAAKFGIERLHWVDRYASFTGVALNLAGSATPLLLPVFWQVLGYSLLIHSFLIHLTFFLHIFCFTTLTRTAIIEGVLQHSLWSTNGRNNWSDRLLYIFASVQNCWTFLFA